VSESAPPRVVIADDQNLVRSGFRMILGAAGIPVVGEAADGVQAVSEVLKHRPDVVLMDIRMPEMDGLEATRRILAAGDGRACRIIILTTFDLDQYVYAALTAGASGFAPGSAGRPVLHSDLSDLTPRELDVLRLLARGLSNAELAAQLTLSEDTVKTHVTHILTKLQLRDRVQAVVLAYETGLAGPGAAAE
jgi:DNA-binding NarL/FixJ family response regulator